MKDIDERSGHPAFLSSDYGDFRTYLKGRLRIAD
jgi:hypothetical protein